MILSKQLHARQIPHYLLAANPDGEGAWFHESERDLAARLRQKRPWDPPFEDALATVLAERQLPFLVDAGGLPTPRQAAILGDHCTHAILIGRDEADLTAWRALCTRYQIPVLAEVHSVLGGADAVQSQGPPLTLALGHLVRGRSWRSATSGAWEALCPLVTAALGWDEAALWRHHRTQAPAGSLPFNLDQWRSHHAPGSLLWEPDALPALLGELAPETPLAVYGRSPAWLLAAIAVHSRAPLWCFDARSGWLAVPTVAPDDGVGARWEAVVAVGEASSWLAVRLHAAHLPTGAVQPGPLPTLPTDRPLILTGKLPIWLFAALARHYAATGHIVATYAPQTDSAIQVNGATLGQVITGEGGRSPGDFHFAYTG